VAYAEVCLNNRWIGKWTGTVEWTMEWIEMKISKNIAIQGAAV